MPPPSPLLPPSRETMPAQISRRRKRKATAGAPVLSLLSPRPAASFLFLRLAAAAAAVSQSDRARHRCVGGGRALAGSVAARGHQEAVSVQRSPVTKPVTAMEGPPAVAHATTPRDRDAEIDLRIQMSDGSGPPALVRLCALVLSTDSTLRAQKALTCMAWLFKRENKDTGRHLHDLQNARSGPDVRVTRPSWSACPCGWSVDRSGVFSAFVSLPDDDERNPSPLL